MADTEPPTDPFFSTCKRVIFSPRAFFDADAAALPPRWGPVSFAVLVSALAGSVGALIAGLLNGEGARAIGGAVAALLLSPLFAIPSLYIAAALLHASLIVLGGRRADFRATLACVAYSTAPTLVDVVPVVGAITGIVWRIVVLILGLERTHRTGTARPLTAVLALYAGPVLLALGLRAGAVEAFKVPSGSMSPTVVMGDHIFVNKFTYGPMIPWTDTRFFTRLPPSRADVAVFKFPENKEHDFIKRVIATPGDTLEALNGRPVINGWLVPHCHVGPFRHDNRAAELYVEFLGDKSYFTLFDTNPDEQTCGGGEACGAGLSCRGGICGDLQGPFKVAPEEVWVIGDNRNNSHDSRSWRGGRGAGVPFENLKGRAMFVWMSFGPGGGVVQDRLFADIHGSPTLPTEYASTLGPAVEKCLREKPSQTSPPTAQRNGSAPP